jgi:type I restriction enzyme S subunit
MKDWELVSLDNVCKLINGRAYKQEELLKEGKYPVLRVGNFFSNRSWYYSNLELDDSKYCNDGDLLYAWSASFGPRIWQGGKVIYHYHIWKTELDQSRVFKRFLYYWFEWDTERIKAEQGVGTTMIHVTKGAMEDRTLYIPPLAEQKRIVAILDEAFEGIDSAIANTEKNLANSRELFENYLQNLDAEKESLGNLVDIRTGKLDANAATEDGQYPFFTCSREIYKIDSFAFDCEAILLAGNNAVGDFNVKHYKGQFNAYQRTYVITVNTEKKILYRYLYFQMLKSLKEFKLQSVGAGTKFLKLGMIQDLRIALPTIEKQQEIISTLDKLKAETQRLETIYRQKLAALKELKQSILQKAFTGELTADTSKTVKEKIAA